MPNNIAYFALIAWPIISIVLYKKYSIITATFWTIVGGYLLLPVGTEFDFPLIPALDKKSIPAIMAYLGCKFIAKKNIKILPSRGIERNLIILFFIGTVATVFTNGEPVSEMNRYIPGLGFRDILSTVISQWLLLMPFILGLQLVKTHDDQILFLKLLVIAGIFYSLPILFEIRMSPQLHRWTYGFFPHSWIQQIRYSGFRPVVFLGHGLWVSIFIFTVLGSLISLSKLKIKLFRFSDTLLIAFFLGLLILSKGVGSILLGISLLGIMILLKAESINSVARIIALTAITYPLLCLVDLFPHQYLIDSAQIIDPTRADSLKYRFDQESAVLERASQKILFGWGGWDRNRLEDSVTDGYWVILVGKYGLLGFAAIFGLIFNTIWKAKEICRIETDRKTKQFMAGISLTIAFLMIDQIPNASINPLLWLMVGAQAGRSRDVISNYRINKSNQVAS
jgi:hypothetical protein